MEQNLQSTGMSREFKQTENSNDAEEFKNVSILDVRDEVLKTKVCVEADCSHKVDNVYGRLEKITAVWTAEEPSNKQRH